ncbi:tetratricopeptide (TPR) repeat protein [Chryseobacterium bernardetii]|uniref:Tetratricopeptide repeat protein n=3 Tax=Chryseobacterium TaxID=59732 RepID=A0A543EHD6_9FLAO|nr:MULTISPECIES: tetratricopeptide repeat protein [Chryseobacterium]MDR6371018.1 tetratricopeptide (TPR) repeat protein [Chryseobacterium vietnamense]MDR6441236.1 tetratricopeptide (TPR) repeat protein [Chryseobacterium bernardetii]MDR6457526.1 tetratricopeptide (TPR) repeat protein [Chryseobacterium vietnamense]TQM21008.1 tetratricopeptide repeat protein [Chryseobacterium aquifrigidense]
MMKRGICLCIILLSFKNLTAQSVKIDPEKLLEYYETQRYADAAQYLQGLYPGDTQDIKALSQIAYCNMMAGKLPDAEKNYLKINTIHPNNLPTLFSLATINSRRGNVSNAKNYLQQIIQLDSLNFSAYKQLAAYAETPESRLNYLKKANILNATDPDVAYDLSTTYSGLKHYQPAYDVLKTAIAADPENFTLQQALLPVANQLTKYPEVIEIGEKLLKNHADVNVMNDMGQAYFYVKDYQKCIMFYKTMEDMGVQNEGTLYFMALSYRELKDYNNAALYAQKTIDEAISDHTSLYYAALAGIYEAKNQYSDAVTAYKRGLTFGTSNIIYYRLGLLYDLNLKQPKNAAIYYQMYLKNNPDQEKEKEQIAYVKERIPVLK